MLVQVKEIMSANVLYINHDNTVKEASELMSNNKVSSLLVKYNNETGIITERDIVSKFLVLDDLDSNVKVSEFMSCPVISVTENDDLEFAVNLMTSKNIKKLAVTNDDNNIIGILSIYDVIRFHPELVSNIHRGYDTNTRQVRHDLRGALFAAKSAVSLIKKDISMTEKCVPIIEQTIDYMGKIIEDWKKSEDQVSINREQIRLSELIESAVKTVFIPDSVKISYSIEEDSNVYLDYTKMIRVLSNLLKNSLEAMNNKGSIHLEAKTVANGVRVSIRDSGAGIKPELVTRIFDPMFSTKSTGLGLGLSFVKDVIEAHGGDVIVKSESKTGSEFILNVPTL